MYSGGRELRRVWEVPDLHSRSILCGFFVYGLPARKREAMACVAGDEDRLDNSRSARAESKGGHDPYGFVVQGCRVVELTQSSGRFGCAGCVGRTRHWAPRCRPFGRLSPRLYRTDQLCWTYTPLGTSLATVCPFVTSSIQNGWFQNTMNIPVGSAAFVGWLWLDRWFGSSTETSPGHRESRRRVCPY